MPLWLWAHVHDAHLMSTPPCALQFPVELEEPCIRAVHHSLLRLDDLVTAIYEQHKAPGGKENEGSAAPIAASPHASKKGQVTKRVLKRWILEVGGQRGWP